MITGSARRADRASRARRPWNRNYAVNGRRRQGDDELFSTYSRARPLIVSTTCLGRKLRPAMVDFNYDDR